MSGVPARVVNIVSPVRLCRCNFPPFIQAVKPNYAFDWYHDLMIDLVEEAVETGGNLLCAAPPGSGISETKRRLHLKFSIRRRARERAPS